MAGLTWYQISAHVTLRDGAELPDHLTVLRGLSEMGFGLVDDLDLREVKS
jgi:hypothetical protein